MISFNDYVYQVEELVKEFGFSIKSIDDHHFAILNDSFCFKIYDQTGHGYSFSYMISDKLIDGHYQNGEYASNYFENFIQSPDVCSELDRTYEGYCNNINSFISKLPFLLSSLQSYGDGFWINFKKYVHDEVNKKYPGYNNSK